MLGIIGMVAVQQHFHKRRSLASGLYATGFSVGLCVAPPTTRVLIDTYCWQGALLIFAGAALNVTVAASLFHPMTSHKTRGKECKGNTKAMEKKFSMKFLTN